MVFTILIISAFLCGTIASPIGRLRRQYYADFAMASQLCNPATRTTYGFGLPCVPMQPSETMCVKRRRLSEPAWTKPECNADGSFREYQCDAYSRGRCWCVYDNGMMIPGSMQDLGDPNQQYKRLDCASKKASAPKPTENPPTLGTPYTNQRLGWNLDYRQAAMANNPYAYYAGYYGYPSSVNSYYQHQQSYPSPSTPPAASSVASYQGAATGMASNSCPYPCPPPCTCMPGAYRTSMPRVTYVHRPMLEPEQVKAGDGDDDNNDDDDDDEKEDEPPRGEDDDDDEKTEKSENNERINNDDNDDGEEDKASGSGASEVLNADEDEKEDDNADNDVKNDNDEDDDSDGKKTSDEKKEIDNNGKFEEEKSVENAVDNKHDKEVNKEDNKTKDKQQTSEKAEKTDDTKVVVVKPADKTEDKADKQTKDIEKTPKQAASDEKTKVVNVKEMDGTLAADTQSAATENEVKDEVDDIAAGDEEDEPKTKSVADKKSAKSSKRESIDFIDEDEVEH